MVYAQELITALYRHEQRGCLWCLGAGVLIDVVISCDEEKVFVIPCRCNPRNEERNEDRQDSR